MLRSLLVPSGILTSLVVVGACTTTAVGGGSGGSGGSDSGSDCDKVCGMAANIDCASDDCVSKCEQQLPKCDAEWRTVVGCMANKGVECDNGQISPFNCDSENAAFTSCLTSGTGGSGGTGGSSGGTDCQKFCDKASAAGCEPTDCVNKCETPLPMCDAELDAVTHCGANEGTITCSSGKPNVNGCDQQITNLTTCLTGSTTSCYANEGQCDPMDPTSCGSGEACDIEGTNNTFVCFPPPNTVPIGGFCSLPDGPYCAMGGTCGSDSVCHKWCCSDADCGGGSCTTLGTAGSIEIKGCQ